MHQYGVFRRLLGGCAGENGKMTRWGEIKCPRCEELEAKLRKSALQELSALGQASEAYQAQLTAEAKLQDQTHLIEQLFALLNKTEETDDGRFFHPNQLRSCRVADTEKLETILAKLKGQGDE